MTQEQKDKLFKALCMYLPHEIKFKCSEGSMIYTLVSVHKNIDDCTFDGKHHKGCMLVGMNPKPILRPLSDLSTEIEHNGERFVPIDWINANLEEMYFVEGRFSKNKDGSFVYWLKDSIPHCNFQKLIEWHFDAFDLIPEGLALDIGGEK